MAVIHKSPFPDVEIPAVALTDYVLRRVDEVPTRPAMVDGATGYTLTFAQLRDEIRALAGGLAERGFGPGSTLGLMAPNMPEYAVVFHGAAVAGGTVTTINPTYGAEEVRFQLADARASILVTVPAFAETAREAIGGSGSIELYVIGEAEGVESWRTLFGKPIGQVAVDPASAVVALPYSSGTTGLPKGVMLTHRNLVANLAQCVPIMPYEDGEVALAVLPFFHIYGMQVLMNGLLAEGCTVVTLPRFDLKVALELIQQHQVTRFFAVPPIVLALAKHPLVDDYDVSSIRQIFCGAAPLGAELAEAASARLGTEVVQGYGMTELSPVSHATPPGGYKTGSVGVTVPNTECRIVAEDGTDQDVDGGEGELWVRGPLVMAGYLNAPDATAATIDDEGWLHTGDVARIDGDGHVYIVDRVKELIKVKGFQVPPAELEALLVTHQAVADVAVIGIPDEESGELPKAFVVLKPGAEASAADLQDYVAQHLATYKQIRHVEFVEEIPKSASGKILRRLLRQQS